jgi:hypothetical protein
MTASALAPVCYRQTVAAVSGAGALDTFPKTCAAGPASQSREGLRHLAMVSSSVLHMPEQPRRGARAPHRVKCAQTPACARA